VVVDLRNIYRPEEMHNLGFAYTCVGRSSAAVDPLASVARAAALQPNNTAVRDEILAEP
jgi:hypothetical protein